MALRLLNLQLRFLLPLGATLVAAAYLAVPVMDQVTLRWFSRDLNSRGVLVANALSESIAGALQADRPARLRLLFDRAAQDERLYAVGLCSPEGRLLQSTERFPATLGCADARRIAQDSEPRLDLAGGAVHVGVQDVMAARPAPPPPPTSVSITEPAAAREAAAAAALAASQAASQAEVALDSGASPAPQVLVARLVLLHDLSFISRRSQDTRN